MARISIEERGRAIGMIQVGTSLRQTLRSKYRQTGSVADRPRRPRRRVTTYRQDRIITLSRKIGIHSRTVASQTVQNRLRIVGIKCRRPKKAPILTNRHNKARLAWARRHFRFTRVDWANILFVDETRIFLNGADSRTRIYRRRGDRIVECGIQEVDRIAGGSQYTLTCLYRDLDDQALYFLG
ncbi:hypothetical protein KUTeg_012263 [Tegillarca granosa]|uniref:Transposase Tc1-like domain-containing protein n=1 Tax=Tegillarca granosa TaxID=220873 RepID=A0ABQ9EZ20_TEGGR|nr:hypothetical protein KUTeg_012263 [Tegillarca granosa]